MNYIQIMRRFALTATVASTLFVTFCTKAQTNVLWERTSQPSRMALHSQVLENLHDQAKREFIIVLPSGNRIAAVLGQRINGEEPHAMYGSLADGGFFQLIGDAGDVHGEIVSLSEGHFDVRTGSTGVELRQIDESRTLQCVGATRVPVPAPARSRENLRRPPVAGFSQIDVLVLYTRQARLGNNGGVESGSVQAMQKFISDCSYSNNIAYSNSRISARINIVNSTEVQFLESGNLSVDLGLLSNRGEDPSDQIYQLRQQYKADLVALLVEPADRGGQSYEPATKSSYSVDWAPYAYSVIQRESALSNKNFAHELGHVLGASHDLYHNGPGLTTESYGWQFTFSQHPVHTIMAYRQSDDSRAFPYFSDPAIGLKDSTGSFVPFGGTPTDFPTYPPSRNATTLRSTLPIAATFR